MQARGEAGPAVEPGGGGRQAARNHHRLRPKRQTGAWSFLPTNWGEPRGASQGRGGREDEFSALGRGLRRGGRRECNPAGAPKRSWTRWVRNGKQESGEVAGRLAASVVGGMSRARDVRCVNMIMRGEGD